MGRSGIDSPFFLFTPGRNRFRRTVYILNVD